MTLLATIAALQATLDGNPTWEIAKGVMLSLSTASILASAALLWRLRDGVRDLKREVCGEDGKNGLKSEMRNVLRRLTAIEARNIAVDAVAEAERELHDGPDRRHHARRLRDKIHDAHDSAEHPIDPLGED